MNAPDDTPECQARRILSDCAMKHELITYQALATALGLSPPGAIARTARVLEGLMHDDAAAGRPLLAAIVVSRADHLPRPGFFLLAAALGRFGADPSRHPEEWRAERDAVWQAARGVQRNG